MSKGLNFLIVSILFCFFSIGSTAQQKSTQNVHQYVVVPSEVSFQTVANQPNCPIKFENLKFLAGIEGGFTNSYNLRNIGKKPILSVTIGSTTGAVNTYRNNGKVLMAPGQRMLEPRGSRSTVRDKIVPLTNELREKLKLTGPMKGIVILMIINIEFADGTRFNDEKSFNALQSYVEEIRDAIYQSKQNNRH